MKKKSGIPEELNKVVYNLARKLKDEKITFIEHGDMKVKPDPQGPFLYGIYLPDGMGVINCNASRILWELWQAGIRNREDLIVLAEAVERKALGKSAGHFIPELEPFFDATVEPLSRVTGIKSDVFN